MPVNLELYGKINYAGVHDDELDPVYNFEIKNRRRKFYDVDEENGVTEVLAKQENWKENSEYMDKRLKEFLPEP